MKKLSLVLLLTLSATSTMLPMWRPKSWRTWRYIPWVQPIKKLKHYINRPTKLDSLDLDKMYVSELLALYDLLDSQRYKEFKKNEKRNDFHNFFKFSHLKREGNKLYFGNDDTPFKSKQFRHAKTLIKLDVEINEVGNQVTTKDYFIDILHGPFGDFDCDRWKATYLKKQTHLIDEHSEIVETHLNRVIKKADEHTPAPLSFANKVNPFKPLHPKDKKLIESSEMLTEWYNKFTAHCKNCTKLKDPEKDSE